MRARIVPAVLVAVLAASACNSAVTSPSPGAAAPSSRSQDADRTWSRHVLGPDAPFLATVLPVESGLLAVGLSPSGGGVWSSADGMAWAPVFPPEEQLVLGALASGGGRFVAGGRLTRSDGSGEGHIRVSADGVSWSPASVQPERSGDIYGVAFHDGVWVAIGAGDGSAQDSRVIWTSTDGTNWRHVAVPDPGRLVSVVAGDAGFVAVGEGPSGQSGVPAAVVLTSADGSRWTGLEDATPFGFTSLAAAAFGDGQYLIGGVQFQLPDGGVTSAAWRSTDAKAWGAVAIDDDQVVPGGSDGKPVFAEGTFMLRIARTPDGWIASGLATDAGTETMAQDVAIWTSSDGAAFRREPHRLAFEAGEGSSLNSAPSALAAWGSSVIIGGRTTGEVPTVWLSPAQPGGTEPSPRPPFVPPPSTEPSPCCAATPAPMAP